MNDRSFVIRLVRALCVGAALLCGSVCQACPPLVVPATASSALLSAHVQVPLACPTLIVPSAAGAYSSAAGCTIDAHLLRLNSAIETFVVVLPAVPVIAVQAVAVQQVVRQSLSLRERVGVRGQGPLTRRQGIALTGLELTAVRGRAKLRQTVRPLRPQRVRTLTVERSVAR